MTAEAVVRMVDAAPVYRPQVHDDEPQAASWTVPAPVTASEWGTARLAPRCIVKDYLFADVAALVAPGGAGKTTAILHEHVCIALGRPVWGLRVETPGPSLIVTAEDRREFLTARLREICAAMHLSDADTARVRELVRIEDVAAAPRRLTGIVADVVVVAEFARAIVEGCRAAEFLPVLVTFDPLVSFGVGESRVNDAEQGLIEAGRAIVAGLDCAVRYVHHVGKANARERTTDAYTGRGGSALADGCRMVAVIQAVEPAELERATGCTLGEDEGAFALHRPKVSYAPPQRHPLFVVRRGYSFRLVARLSADDREDHEAQREAERTRAVRGALLDAAAAANSARLPLSSRMLLDKVRGARTEAKREALAALLAEGWLIEARVPAGWRPLNNGRRTWIVALDPAARAKYLQTGELPDAAVNPPPAIAVRIEGNGGDS